MRGNGEQEAARTIRAIARPGTNTAIGPVRKREAAGRKLPVNAASGLCWSDDGVNHSAPDV